MATTVAMSVASALSACTRLSTNDLSILRIVAGKRLQVGERRVLGAEVVDGDAHAELAQLGEGRGGGVRILHHAPIP